jgi:hypothetical protein
MVSFPVGTHASGHYLGNAVSHQALCIVRARIDAPLEGAVDLGRDNRVGFDL